MAVFVEKAVRGTATWSPGQKDGGNTAIGFHALQNNTSAVGNTAIGSAALAVQSFDNGSFWYAGNTAVGEFALGNNQPTATTNGHSNTAIGSGALMFSQAGAFNSALGAQALVALDVGSFNTALGYNAGARVDQITGYLGTPVTFDALDTGSYNTFVSSAGATAEVDNCTAVGMDAYCDATNQVRLGNVFVNSIGGKVAWSTLSDGRAKTNVRSLEQGLPLVLALKPVSYRLRGGNGRADMGFVAQDVEAVLGDTYNVVDAGGDPDRTLSLRYAQLIAPLVKAVQEQQVQIETLRAEVAALKRGQE